MSAAVSQWSRSAPERMETASPEMPSWAPVRAAPTVPEWRTERPTFTPRLMPETIRSGRGPKPPRAPTITVSAGEASSPKVGTDSAPSMVTERYMRASRS